MFHLHTDDDHHGGAFIHSHFPESPHMETNHGPEVEPPHHGHGSARSIDFLTSSAPALAFVEVFTTEETMAFDPPQSCPGFVTLEEPRAHAPPFVVSTVPRSPPV
jgi:hypothetical protein